MTKGKYIILIPDGLAGLPLSAFNGRTVMQVASIPNLDSLAASGRVGRSFNVPAELSPGSDVATLGLLGYNPLECYTGRAPLEVAAQGIPFGAADRAFRCNLVCLQDGKMKSFTAGHISTEEATELLRTLQETIAPRWREIANSVAPAERKGRTVGGTIDFYPGVSYRNLMIFRPDAGDEAFDPFSEKTRTFPPHDYTDQDVEQARPSGDGGSILRTLSNEIADVLKESPVNASRVRRGLLPATHAWLWGQGKRPSLRPFAELHQGIRGAMITAVDLLRGIAADIGWDRIDVPNATGYVDTDFAAKGRFAADALDRYDLVCVHIEATDEAGHEGSVEKKVASVEKIDRETLPPILEKLRSFENWRILVSPDHPTPIELKTHSRGFVPWIVAGSGIQAANPNLKYDEASAENSPFRFDSGWELMNDFLS